jgi:glycosyltransferase involved in cell wall biosynthesis
MNNSLPQVSIVVIGHNEGKNLDKCFTAINNLNYPTDKLEIIYVDSKSTDISLEIAKKYTNNIYKIDSIWPTAGEAFNKGIKESTSDYVHITAGDIFLDKDYLKKAIIFLIENASIQAVTGYFEEENPSGFNKLIGFRREEDEIHDGKFVETPNGGTFKKYALLEINGYDERIKKGQETELGKRFRKAGFKIWHMPIRQGVHDFGINNIGDLIKRHFNNGQSSGHLLFLSFKEGKNETFINGRKSALKLIAINTVLLIGIFLLIVDYHISLSIFLAYLFYYIFKVFFKKGYSKNYKKYKLLMGYLSFITFLGVGAFYLFLMNLNLKGYSLNYKMNGISNIK